MENVRNIEVLKREVSLSSASFKRTENPRGEYFRGTMGKVTEFEETNKSFQEVLKSAEGNR